MHDLLVLLASDTSIVSWRGPDPRVTVVQGPREVRAIHQLKNVEFALEGIEAEFSDNYFDLAPGGIREIQVKAPTVKDEKELVKLLRVRQMTDWVKEQE